MQNTIQSALLSVYHKNGLDTIVKHLHRLGVKIYATGGTFDFIQQMGIPVIAIEDITGYPSILGGRVKTLHPAVFGGILAIRNDEEHQSQMEEFKLPFLDLIVVDLYPFQETVASGETEEAIIEKIDIGGISLIRAAAKNFNDVVIIPTVNDYPKLIDILENQDGKTSVEERKAQALSAFNVSSTYDTAIFNWFAKKDQQKPSIEIPSSWESKSLRYGENPHQKASFKGNLTEVFRQLHGKELSYNNLLDVDAALNIINDFEEPTIAVIKHNNACGIASDSSLLKAWEKALAGDPVSAFGGVIVSNKVITKEIASSMNLLFFEVLMAPAFEEEALVILQVKKNRILLETTSYNKSVQNLRTVLNGVLVQEPDNSIEKIEDMKVVTTKVPTASEYKDLVFANKVVKHSKSNAIVLAKDGQLLASGVGQTSRIDALKQAIEKANHFGFSIEGSVMASDAFFPFPDCIQIAHEAGVTAVIQPGGSLRDQDSTDEANKSGMAMVITNIRHFKH